jgi:hypothetical protein
METYLKIKNNYFKLKYFRLFNPISTFFTYPVITSIGFNFTFIINISNLDCGLYRNPKQKINFTDNGDFDISLNYNNICQRKAEHLYYCSVIERKLFLLFEIFLNKFIQ